MVYRGRFGRRWCRDVSNGMSRNMTIMYKPRRTLLSCRDMPWHCRGTACAKHLSRYTTDPSRHLHRISWNSNLPLGAVETGVPRALPTYICCRVAVDAGVAMGRPMAVPPTVCHGILWHGMGCRGDVIVCNGWYHGNAMACHENAK